MENIVKEYMDRFDRNHRRQHRYVCLLGVLALLVCLAVFWRLKLVGTAMTSEASCGLQEHTHTDSCYTTVLACTVATSETAAGEHVHTDDCYKRKLVCTIPEHTHTADCYSDAEADTEGESDWTQSFPQEALTGDWAQDTVTIAASQMGYAESTRNWQLNDDGTRSGYTRYGAWYGNPYGGWNGMFAAFCLHYAGVDEEYLTTANAAGVNAWAVALYQKGELQGPGHEAVPGDIVFLGHDDKIETCAVVADVAEEDGVPTLTLIAGDVDNTVEELTVPADSDTVLGYAATAEAYAAYTQDYPDGKHATDEMAEPAATATPETAEPEKETAEMLQYEGADYTITLTCGPEAGIPVDAELSVRELAPDSEEYETYYQQAEDIVAGEGCVTGLRLFDIEILADGEKIEPAAEVSLTVTYAAGERIAEGKEKAIHFGEDGSQVLDAEAVENADGGTDVTVMADGFSPFAFFQVAAQASGTGYDLTNTLTGVKLEKKESNGVWSVLSPDENGVYNVKENDNLRFEVGFTVPIGTLNPSTPEGRTVYYKMPMALENKAEGPITNSAGEQIGTYVMEKDGTVKLTYTEEYAKNNTTSAITGSFYYTCSVKKVGNGSDNKQEFKFNDKVTISIRAEDRQITTGDLTVSKQRNSQNDKDFTAWFTITAESKNGTSTGPEIKDTLDAGLNYKEDTLVVKDKNGAVVRADKYTLTATTTSDKKTVLTVKFKDGFEAGDKYQLTYETELADKAVNGKVKKNNTVHATAEDQDGNHLKSDASASVEYNRNIIKKEGEAAGDGKSITWKITINSSKVDISGWTLRDTLAGTSFTDPVTIKGSDGTVFAKDVPLPYTFPDGSTDTYTIEYTTTYDENQPLRPGVNKIKNEATLEKNSQKQGSASTEVERKWINPFEKTGKITDVTDNVVTVTWTAKVKAPEDFPLATGWTLQDTLNYGSYFTEEQQKETEAAFKQSASAIGWTNCTFSWKKDGQNRVNGFEVKFNNQVPAGKEIAFTYRSSYTLSDSEKQNGVELSNSIKSNERPLTATAKVTYKPSDIRITKVDERNEGGGSNTAHDYNDLDNGLLKWKVNLYIPAQAAEEDLIVTENLPQNVTLNKLSMNIDNNDTKEFEFSNGTAEKTWNNNGNPVTLTAVKNADGTVTINIPKEAVTRLKGKQLTFWVYAKINDGVMRLSKSETTKTEVFNNTVTVTNTSQKKYGEASQTQQIKEDAARDAIVKTGSLSSGTYNVYHYTVDINKKSYDLLKSGDTLTFVDTLSYEVQDNIPFAFELDMSSLHAYKNGDTNQEIPIQPVLKTTTRRASAKSNIVTKTITFEVPDETYVQIVYDYVAKGSVQECKVNNTGELTGISSTGSSTSSNILVKITDSGASSEIEYIGINLQKVNADNMKETLQGAHFKLQKLNKDSSDWKQDSNWTDVEKDLVTDANGKISVGSVNGKEITYNTAYRFVETAAPNGFVRSDAPIYFYIYNTDITNYPNQIPKDFSGTKYQNNDTIMVTNHKALTSLTVEKVWLQNGMNVKPGSIDSVQVKLVQHATQTNPWGAGGDTASLQGTLTMGGSNNYMTIVPPEDTVLRNGAQVTLKLIHRWAQNNGEPPTMYVNGAEIAPTEDGPWEKQLDPNNKETGYAWDYTFTVEGTTTLSGFTSNWDNGNWFYEISVTNPADETLDPDTETDMGEYTISADKDWTLTINDLPSVKEIEGKTWYYTYKVVELNADDYDPQYSKDGFVSAGKITITNTLETYDLPKTGGSGTLPYMAGGLALMAEALLCGYYKKRRKEGRQNG